MSLDRATRLASIDEMLMSRQLIVVSNREPYTHRKGKHGLTVDRPAGGLVAALDPVMQLAGGTWIAWGDGDADFEVTDEAGRVLVPCEAPRYMLKRIALSRPEVAGYYHGYSNQVLWPLCHVALERVRVRDRCWRTYQGVNRRFADAAAGEAPREALLWLHDYHLALCPRYIRQTRPDLFLMHFWHIPWPAWDVFRVCPQRTELLDGLLGNDLIAFQHRRHMQYFLECVHRELGARVEDESIRYDGRRIQVVALPISVDVSTLDETAQSLECTRWMGGLRRVLGLEGRSVVVSVDRLDYTKGILERLRAIDLLFRRRPEYRSRVIFVQKVAPSRTQIKAYRDLQTRVEEGIAHLSAQYGTSEWQPIVYLPEPLPPAAMAALYRMADACVVSSLQDGMNLVAKEFVACQGEARGVLLLSELTGAHDELLGAIAINPYDAEACADALARALEMPDEERRGRMTCLRSHLIAHDVYHWMEGHLEAATRSRPGGLASCSVHNAACAVETAMAQGCSLALFLDFDGTLVPLADHPDCVRLPAEVRATLARLSQRQEVIVTVVTGRALNDIRDRIGLDQVIYAGNHGLEIWEGGRTWILPEAERVRSAIEACGHRLRRRLRSFPGAWVEDKGLALTVHYRGTPSALTERVRALSFEESARTVPGALAVQQAPQALEIRPAVSWHKGAAVRKILSETSGELSPMRVCAVHIGNDWTDEEVFRTLPDWAVTIKVGRSLDQTAARYRAHDVEEVHQFLSLIEERLPRAVIWRDVRGGRPGRESGTSVSASSG